MKLETIITNVLTCCAFIIMTYILFSLILWELHIPSWTISARVIGLVLFIFYILYARYRILYEFKAIKEIDKFLNKDEE